MARLILYPYPRFDPSEVVWGSWTAQLDGQMLALEDVADRWDAKSQLRFGISASVKRNALARFEDGQFKMSLTASCRDTAFTFYANSDFISGAETITATAELAVPGNAIAQRLVLGAKILFRATGGQDSLLNRRIVSEFPVTRIGLDSLLDGFPTSAYSFKKHNMPEAPWRVDISADDLEAPFAHSVRLHLNEDYSTVRGLIGGQPKPYVEQELTASITRVLVGAIARLATDDGLQRNVDAVAEEFPDSLAAGVKNAARVYLKKSLQEAISDYVLKPEQLEYSVANGVGLLKVAP